MKKTTIKKRPGTSPKRQSAFAVTTPVKAWQTRIGKAADPLAEKFVESLSFDYRLAEQDIRGSLAHAEMLRSVGLIYPADLAAIRKGLNSILDDIRAGRFQFDQRQEDIHMAVEAALIQRVGDPGRKLHTARSRNDQVALDIRLWCVAAIDTMEQRLTKLQNAFIALAQQDGDVVIPAYTHLQRAQPILFGHELLAYVEMLQRDRGRLADCRKRTNISPLGSGAVAGSTLAIDRLQVARQLGMTDITANSLDSISDRDFVVEFAFALSMIAMHLSRWAEQWILYSSTEFNFLRIADQFTTGSSMMPQKRNPDMLELIRGRTGGVYGQLVALLTMLKGQPLAYNRDMQEDKRWLFAAFDAVELSLQIAVPMVQTVAIKEFFIAQRLEEGFLDATGLAEYLVQKGVPFRTAHQIVGAMVTQCEKRGLQKLMDLPLEAMQRLAPQIGADVMEVLGANHVVAAYQSAGAGGKKQLEAQLKYWQNHRC
ncbi:MAG: argininosuccinate lyase [Phycisphaerae bacterium]